MIGSVTSAAGVFLVSRRRGRRPWRVLWANQQRPLPVMGYLAETTEVTHRPYLAAFWQGLAEQGYIEGRSGNSLSVGGWAARSFAGDGRGQWRQGGDKLLLTKLENQVRRYALRGLLALVIAIVANSVVRSEPTVGYVAELSGHWFLYPSRRGNPQELSLGKDLPARGVVRVKSPSSDDYIRIAKLRGEPLDERFCRVMNMCFKPIYL
jgi:hypothetical protein